MTVVRAGGVATVAGLAGFIFIMIRRERKCHSEPFDSRSALAQDRLREESPADGDSSPSSRLGMTRGGTKR
jgi:hypothetical protein